MQYPEVAIDKALMTFFNDSSINFELISRHRFITENVTRTFATSKHLPDEKCRLKTHFPSVSPPCWSVIKSDIQKRFLFFLSFWNIVKFITPGWIKPHKIQFKGSCWYFFSNDTIKFMLMLLFEKSLLGRYPFVSSASVKLNSYLSIIACLQKLSTVTLCFAISTPFNSGGSVLIVPGETI